MLKWAVKLPFGEVPTLFYVMYFSPYKTVKNICPWTF